METKIVVPGEKISDKPLHADTAYVKDGKSYAAVVGMLNGEGKFTPLENVYTPKFDDTIVGIVIDALSWGYSIDANLASRAGLSSRDTRLRLRIGDIVVGRVRAINPSGEVSLKDVKHLSKGRVFKVPPSKIPRIIGKKSSMLNVIRDNTDTHIIAGNNGYVWVSEQGNVPLVAKVFDEIIDKAHTKGLTDSITAFIEKNK